MPQYPRPMMTTFRNHLRTANPDIEKGLAAKVFGKSSLQPLIGLLDSQTTTPLQLYKAIADLPADKAIRYQVGLTYLLQSHPAVVTTGIRPEDLNVARTNKTNAVRYTRTPLPARYRPDGPQNQRVFVEPPSSFTGMTLVQYILANPDTTGIVLIHLATVNPSLQVQFHGRSTLEHITSVVRVARLVGCPVCVLSINAPHLCAPLLAEYDRIPVARRTLVVEPAHVGTNHLAMRNFLTNKTDVVVMGFDASICVFANVFGSQERMGGADSPFKSPMITMANLVMTRATTACVGPISTVASSTMGRAEYGPLFQE
jgi:hypothetical protein